MKNIKEYLNEGLIKRQAGADIKSKIREWLDKYCKIRYAYWNEDGVVINDDLTIDITNCEYITVTDQWKEKKLPDYIQFGCINGDFFISCDYLETLRGCPREVGGKFSCSFCHKLKNLEGTPKKCKEFHCNYCTSLENFVGGPEYVELKFNACGCSNLKSFEGIPKKLKSLNVRDNHHLYKFPHPITQKQLKKLYDCDVDKIMK